MKYTEIEIKEQLQRVVASTHVIPIVPALEELLEGMLFQLSNLLLDAGKGRF